MTLSPVCIPCMKNFGVSRVRSQWIVPMASNSCTRSNQHSIMIPSPHHEACPNLSCVIKIRNITDWTLQVSSPSVIIPTLNVTACCAHERTWVKTILGRVFAELLPLCGRFVVAERLKNTVIVPNSYLSSASEQPNHLLTSSVFSR